MNSLPEPDHLASKADPKWFSTTHWSVVLEARNDLSTRANEALECLCRTYWPPLYAYVRRQGHTSPDAQDLTQEFFAHFLRKQYLRAVDRERGRFRSFLLACLKHFLAHEWEKSRALKRGGQHQIVPWDEHSAEDWFAREAVDSMSPEQFYDRRWALTVLERALRRLREEAAAHGRSGQFEELKIFLSSEPEQGAYAKVADRLELTANGVAVAVHRLRQRYGELVREEIAQTLSSAGDVEDELRHLAAAVNSCSGADS